MKKIITLTTLLTATLLFSGCSATTSEIKPVAKTQQSFHEEISMEHVKASILSAAKKSEWQVESSSLENGAQIMVKKVYEQRRTISSHPAYRNMRKTVSSSVYANVHYTPKGFEIQISDAAGVAVQPENTKANDDIAALKEAIIMELDAAKTQANA